MGAPQHIPGELDSFPQDAHLYMAILKLTPIPNRRFVPEILRKEWHSNAIFGFVVRHERTQHGELAKLIRNAP